MRWSGWPWEARKEGKEIKDEGEQREEIKKDKDRSLVQPEESCNTNAKQPKTVYFHFERCC